MYKKVAAAMCVLLVWACCPSRTVIVSATRSAAAGCGQMFGYQINCQGDTLYYVVRSNCGGHIQTTKWKY